MRTLDPFGVEIEGSIFDKSHQELRRLLFNHALVIFKNQRLTPDDLRRVAQIFGKTWQNSKFLNCTLDTDKPDILRISSDVGNNMVPKGLFGAKEVEWHSDGSILPGQFFGAALYGKHKPELATTSWCYTRPILESLPEAHDPEFLAAEARFHCFTDEFDVVSYDAQDAIRLDQAWVSHKLLQNHPVTGALCAMVSPASLLPGREKDLALGLARKLIRDEFVYTHTWSEGDLILFDNLQTMHRRSEVSGPGREVWRIQFNFENCAEII